MPLCHEASPSQLFATTLQAVRLESDVAFGNPAGHTCQEPSDWTFVVQGEDRARAARRRLNAVVSADTHVDMSLDKAMLQDVVQKSSKARQAA